MPRKMKKHAAPAADEPPAKRAKFLSDDDDSEAEGTNDANHDLLNINKDFAQRFEHNKKREEKQRRMFTSCSIICIIPGRLG